MKLLEKQFLFTRNISRLIRYAYNLSDEFDGFIPEAHEELEVTLTFGRAHASEAANRADKGIKGSCHTMRLAVDFNLFVNGEYMKGDHWVWHALGKYWVSLDRDNNRWGGNFRSRDYNHFSMRHGGKQ